MKKLLLLSFLFFGACVQTDESPATINKILAARQRTHENRMQELNNLTLQLKAMQASLDNEKRIIDTLASMTQLIKVDSL
jgi:hypothetical protein